MELTEVHKIVALQSIRNQINGLNFEERYLVSIALFNTAKNLNIDVTREPVWTDQLKAFILTEVRRLLKVSNKLFKTQKTLYENEIKNQRRCLDLAFVAGDYKSASVISERIYKLETNIDKLYIDEADKNFNERRKKRMIELLDKSENGLKSMLGFDLEVDI